MTVVVAFMCTDGVVVAADSMLTASMGNIPLAHHKGKKVHTLPGNQVFAFAGNQGLAARFQMFAELNYAQIQNVQHPILYPITLTQTALQQFAATQIDVKNLDLNMILAFVHQGSHQCCVFEGSSAQPRLLDQDHFYVALGSGKVAADPFLRFLYEVFCQGKQPSLRDAIFLATWAIQYVIETVPGGVSDPIYIGLLERDAAGQYSAEELPDPEVQELWEAISDAHEALRTWRDSFQSEKAPEEVPTKPEPPGHPEEDEIAPQRPRAAP